MVSCDVLQNCSVLTKTVEETGVIMREIRELEDQVGIAITSLDQTGCGVTSLDQVGLAITSLDQVGCGITSLLQDRLWYI